MTVRNYLILVNDEDPNQEGLLEVPLLEARADQNLLSKVDDENLNGESSSLHVTLGDESDLASIPATTSLDIDEVPPAAPLDSPYVVDAKYVLEFTPSATVRGWPNDLVEATVLEIFEPFTISPVLKVKLEFTARSVESTAVPALPPVMIFKTYDRRFAHDLREFHDVAPATYESETNYQKFLFGHGSVVPKWTQEEWLENEERPPEEIEAYLDGIVNTQYNNEVRSYNILADMQGKGIPILFGTTRFSPHEHNPATIDYSVPGVLLEFIDGTPLSKIEPKTISQDVGKAALSIVDKYGDLGILNKDVRMDNFIIPSFGTSLDRLIVMIDFAQVEFRGEEEDDGSWKRRKWSQDEEGAVGYPLKKTHGWEYKPTWKYLVPADENEN